jgi:hypothetical protein
MMLVCPSLALRVGLIDDVVRPSLALRAGLIDDVVRPSLARKLHPSS